MLTLFAICLSLATVGADDPRPCVIVVVGAPGEPEYGAEFRRWADLWQAAAAKAGAESIRIGLDPESAPDDRERLRATLAAKVAGPEVREPLWLVLIGHGSYDGREAKFNLRGPDVSDADLAAWLAPIGRPIVAIDCASASGPFLNRLSGENRVVITATKSGSETNYARFGQYLAESIADPKADLDKDGQVSLLEAFLTAGSRTAEFYKGKSRLATEHALLDDNGDKLGTQADWFRGIRAVKRARDGATPDGTRSHQMALVRSDRERAIPPEVRRKRDAIELSIAALRDQKATLTEDEYYRRLESMMVELARLYRDLPADPSGHAH